MTALGAKAMRFQDTVLSGVLKAVPRDQFAKLVQAHGSDRRVRRLSSWSQLVALLMTQLAGCVSLREIEAILGSQEGSRYHLGTQRVCRSTLAVANAKRPAGLFDALFDVLRHRLGHRLPAGVGREAVRLVDATSIRLGETVHRWAQRSTEHAGVKLHLVFDPTASLPTYFTITPCRINDIVEAEKLPLEPGATYVMDRGYYDFAFWWSLDQAGCRFVSRLKAHSPTRLVEERPVAGDGILADRRVRLNPRLRRQGRNPYQQPVREILVRRADGRVLRLVTNDLDRPAQAIAELYKARWQIELFFKWIKQNLKIKRFLGTSENAIRVQIITALIAYLLIHYAHRLSHLPTTRQRFRQLLRANLWQRRPLTALLHTKPLQPLPTSQLALPLP
jgi:hypothetical protein